MSKKCFNGGFRSDWVYMYWFFDVKMERMVILFGVFFFNNMIYFKVMLIFFFDLIMLVRINCIIKIFNMF